MKDIYIVSATRHTKDSFFENTQLGKCISKMKELIIYNIFYENNVGLTKLYQSVLNDEIVKDKIVLFVHDDVSIEDSMLKEKLNEAIKTFDIIGLAGSKNVDLKKPAAWHLMTNNVDWSGAVAHIKDGQTFMTSFGSMPKEVDLIDGLFMAINVEKVKDVLFDEQFQFHHYDLDMCMTAKKQGLKIGTYPIWVTHLGLGDSMYSNEWKENAKKFSAKWRR